MTKTDNLPQLAAGPGLNEASLRLIASSTGFELVECDKLETGYIFYESFQNSVARSSEAPPDLRASLEHWCERAEAALTQVRSRRVQAVALIDCSAKLDEIKNVLSSQGGEDLDLDAFQPAPVSPILFLAADSMLRAKPNALALANELRGRSLVASGPMSNQELAIEAVVERAALSSSHRAELAQKEIILQKLHASLESVRAELAAKAKALGVAENFREQGRKAHQKTRSELRSVHKALEHTNENLKAAQLAEQDALRLNDELKAVIGATRQEIWQKEEALQAIDAKFEVSERARATLRSDLQAARREIQEKEEALLTAQARIESAAAKLAEEQGRAKTLSGQIEALDTGRVDQKLDQTVKLADNASRIERNHPGELGLQKTFSAQFGRHQGEILGTVLIRRFNTKGFDASLDTTFGPENGRRMREWFKKSISSDISEQQALEWKLKYDAIKSSRTWRLFAPYRALIARLK